MDVRVNWMEQYGITKEPTRRYGILQLFGIGVWNLRKVRARMMAEAYNNAHGRSDDQFASKRGNNVIYYNKTAFCYFFLYRGTMIAKWNVLTNEYSDIPCEEYEGTASTRNQRNMVKQAIEEFNREVFRT